MPLRVLSILGTRPEAVKMAPVIQALARKPAIEARVCITAQHRQMLDQTLDLFDITADYDLDLMRENQSLSQLSAAIFTHLDPILKDLRPDWILVEGDTTTVMVSSLLAYYHRIKLGHVEAGLRTGDKWQPFPEEINRRVAGILADLHFAPTEWARQNLLEEGVPGSKIVVTGNPVIDALQQAVSQPEPPELGHMLKDITPFLNRSARLVLVTAHRRENFGEPLENICQALRQLAAHYGDEVQIIYPVHLNPNVQKTVREILSGIRNILLLPPLDYLPWVHLLKRASLLLTDSGGLQEEAPGLGVPVLVLREVTERPEGIHAGTVRLVGTDTQRIMNETMRLLDDEQAHKSMSHAVNPYGDGKAAERIVEAILTYEETQG